jgi:hypothetical protein
LDEEKSKTCGFLAQECGFGSLSVIARFAVIAERRSNGVPPTKKSVIDLRYVIRLLLSIF